MKNYNTQNVRNVVLLGSSKSGKTTLAETMMFEGKVIDRRGSIEAKTTVSDNTEIEQKKPTTLVTLYQMKTSVIIFSLKILLQR